MNPKELISDETTFHSLRTQCEKLIKTDKRFPDFVFQHPFARYFILEHGYIFSKEFASFLMQVSRILGDESVNYMTLEPDPVDYYYRNLSFFGAASFNVSNLAERYFPVMSRDMNVDSFQFRGGDVSAFWGPSLKWAISCDRISWELAIIAVPENIDVPTVSGMRCLDAPTLKSYITSQYQAKDPSGLIARSFIEKLSTNYCI